MNRDFYIIFGFLHAKEKEQHNKNDFKNHKVEENLKTIHKS